MHLRKANFRKRKFGAFPVRSVEMRLFCAFISTTKNDFPNLYNIPERNPSDFYEIR